MHLQTLTTTLALAGVGMSLPTTSGNNQESAAAPLPLSKRSAADTILMIMPTSGSCSGRGDECVTADVAAPYLVSGMTHYSVSTAMEQAGILSLVAYESNEMQYKKNLNNAASGQGTSNEQSGTFNLEFANTFAELKALGLTTSNVLDYVTNNTYNFWTVSSLKKKKKKGKGNQPLANFWKKL